MSIAAAEMESENPAQCSSIKIRISEQSFRLPEEVIEEILSRLPVKSLLKFRCVSKPWRSLIDSKRFIKIHLDSSTKNPEFTHHNIIFNSVAQRRCGPKQCSLLSMLSDPLTDQFTSCDLENVRLDSVSIVDCCNGLVCLLLDEQHFMLWNPSTRKTKKLPVFDHNLPVSDRNRDRRGWGISDRGFGYDDLSGDYMVFGMVIVSYTALTRRYEAICKVYSLQSNSWKKVEVENAYPFHRRGKYASGKIHWFKTRGGDTDIVYFDLRNEVFDVIPPPFRIGHFHVSMGVLGGRLGMLYDDGVANLYIWVLKEYGVNSWEKVVNIPYLDKASYLSLLGIGPNGEILLSSRSCFEIFCPEGNGFRRSQVRDLGEFREAVVFVESLVPPCSARDA